MNEWRAVCGWEGVYEVSSGGQVRRVLASPGTRAGYVLRGRLSTAKTDSWRTRYLKVALTLDGTRADTPIHHLVAAAFLGQRPDGYEINHKDGNPQNNAASNLEYVTHSENIKHAWSTGLRRRKAA